MIAAFQEEVTAEPKQSVSKWAWNGLGVLAVGALASSGDDGGGVDTGTITINGPTP